VRLNVGLLRQKVRLTRQLFRGFNVRSAGSNAEESGRINRLCDSRSRGTERGHTGGMASRSGGSRKQAARPNGIDVAIAVAKERVADAHLEHAIAFLQFVSGEISAPRALAFHARLHSLSEEDYRNLRNRVLATVGGIAAGAPNEPPLGAPGPEAAIDWNEDTSLFRRMRRRFGGRRDRRLRRRMELFAGKVQAALIRVHVESIRRLLELHDPEAGVSGVVHAYMSELGIRPALYQAIYIPTLESLSAEMERAEATPAPAEESDAPVVALPSRKRRSG
jgi:hypothetical protein